MQTGELDLAAFNTSTGSILWTTWDQAQGDGARPQHRRLRPRPPPRRRTHSSPLSAGRAPLASPAVLPSYLVSAAYDAPRGLVYEQDTDEVRAVEAADGAGVAWSVGLDGETMQSPFWTSVAGRGHIMLLPAAANGASTAAPATAAPPLSPGVLLLVSVYSPIGGVVTADWLVRVQVGEEPQVLWWSPVAYGGTTRSGCLWPPAMSAYGTAAFLTCDTDKLGASTRNTTLFAFSLADGSQLWNASLRPPGVPRQVNTVSAYFTAPVLLQPSGSAAGGTMTVGSCQPGAAGAWSFSLGAANELLAATFHPAPATGPGSGGWQGSVLVWQPPDTPDTPPLLVGFSADGAVTALDPASLPAPGSPLSWAWALDLALPPVGTHANWGQYGRSPWAADAATGTLWLQWTSYNSSGALVGVCAPFAGSHALPSLAYSGWPAGVPGLGSTAWRVMWDLPVRLPTEAGGAVRLLLAGAPALPTAVDMPVRCAAAGAVQSGGAAADPPGAVRAGAAAGGHRSAPAPGSTALSATPLAMPSSPWSLPAPGAVMGTPLLVTNPANASQALLVYWGWNDGLLRAADPGAGTPLPGTASMRSAAAAGSGVVWATDPQSPDGDIAFNGCTASWLADMLVCVGAYGSITVLRLSTGQVAVTLSLRNHWSAVTGAAPFPATTGSVALLDDAASPSGFSIALVMVHSGSSMQGVLALVHVPAFASAPNPAPEISIVWTALSGTNSFGNSVTFTGVLLASSTSTAGANSLLFVHRWFADVQAYNAASGALVWTSTAWRPEQPAGAAWRVTGMAYDEATGALFVSVLQSLYHTDEEGGAVAALDAATGALLWLTPPLCAIGSGGLMVQRLAWQALVYASCSNAGPIGLPGKVAVLSAVDGSLLGVAGTPDGAMVGGPSLVLTPAAARGGVDAGATDLVAVVYGAAGGIVVVSNASAALGSGRVLRRTTPVRGTAATPVALPAIGADALPGAATPVEWTMLNVYPSFTFALASDASGVLYGAGGDDKGVYAIALPGVAAPCGGAAPSASPSASAAPSAGPPSRREAAPATLSAGAITGLVGASMLGVAAAVTAVARVRAGVNGGGGTRSRQVPDGADSHIATWAVAAARTLTGVPRVGRTGAGVGLSARAIGGVYEQLPTLE